jgi:hypothetical protein
MPDDRETARHALDLQERSKDYRIVDLPGFMEWSRRALAKGVSDALIAHLDATSLWLLPEEAAKMTETDYDKLLDELKVELKKAH